MDQDQHDNSVESQRNDDGADAPVLKNDGGAERAESKTDRDQNSKINSLQDYIRRGERWMIYLTAAMALSALSTVVVGVFQWKVMSGQLAEMHGTGVQTDRLIAAADAISGHQKQMVDDNKTNLAQNKTAIENTLKENRDELAKLLSENRKALNASIAQGQAAINASIDASRLDQRAWVMVSGIAGKPTAGQPIDVVIECRNSGKTPAKDVRVMMNVAHVRAGDAPPAIDNRHPHFAKGRELRPSILGPNAPTALHGTIYDISDNVIALSESQIKGLADDQLVLYVRGLLTYRDVFGNHHWSTFCYTWNHDVDGYSPCKNGNDIDRNGEPPPAKPAT